MKRENEKPSSGSFVSLKKLAGLLSILGIIIAGIVGIFTIVQNVEKSKEKEKQIQMYLEAGERFAEHYNIESAIEQYEKILRIDNDNELAQRAIIILLRKKLQFDIGEPPEIDDILAKIYHLQALHPSRKQDPRLLVEEAFLLRRGGRGKAALDVMERAYKVSSDDPEVLAQLGYLRALTSSEENVKGLDLLRRAIEKDPNEARYHAYLAESYGRAKKDAEAIREYYQAARLSNREEMESRLVHDYVVNYLYCRFNDLFWNNYNNFRKGGRLTGSIKMSPQECASIYEYVVAEYGRSSSLRESRYGKLASFYYEAGQLAKANEAMKRMLQIWNIDYEDEVDPWEKYGLWVHWFELHIKILEKSGLDPDMLTRARAYEKAIRIELQRREEAAKVRVILETSEKGHKYRVGLELPSGRSDEGVEVLRVFESYPFAKAGVHKGDKILEIGHRMVTTYHDLTRVLTMFEPGTRLPLKVKRGDKIVSLTLIVE